MSTNDAQRHDAAIQSAKPSRDCCKQPENLTRTVNANGTSKATCSQCGANHYYMRAEPVRIGGKL